MNKNTGFWKKMRIAGAAGVATLCVAGCLAGCTVTVESSGSNVNRDATSTNLTTESYAFSEQITAVTIDCKAADVNIVKGTDQVTIDCNLPADYQPTVECDGETLSITQTADDNVNMNGDWAITIAVPETCDLQTINAEQNLGDFNMSDTDCRSVKVENNLGNITFTNSLMATGELEANLGNIIMTNSSIEEGSVQTNMGDITLDGTYENVKWGTDMGKVTVNGEVLTGDSDDDDED